MASTTKRKVALVIVEGPSDKTALERVLHKALAQSNSTVEVHCVHGDITAKHFTNHNHNTVVDEVRDVVKNYAEKYGLRANNFFQIIQITDTDGAYIPPGFVVSAADITPDPFYTLTDIQTTNPPGIVSRNSWKSDNINTLIRRKTVTWNNVAIPYQLYYLSCNMEHAFHDQNNLNDAQKRTLARQFQHTYGRDVPGFYALLQSLLPPPPCQDYKTSWDYIRQELHSLERCSNLYLALPANAPQSGGDATE